MAEPNTPEVDPPTREYLAELDPGACESQRRRAHQEVNDSDSALLDGKPTEIDALYRRIGLS